MRFDTYRIALLPYIITKAVIDYGKERNAIARLRAIRKVVES